MKVGLEKEVIQKFQAKIGVKKHEKRSVYNQKTPEIRATNRKFNLGPEGLLLNQNWSDKDESEVIEFWKLASEKVQFEYKKPYIVDDSNRIIVGKEDNNAKKDPPR
ncbi:hypothetical protein F8M41_008049 [Gigaspora margarita]|uniref:Uncharacterized protein n=1 Tax=Gigaspora margarita TaxID=4874 RepID=A0A8H4AVY9_GIGMA|nr:hypothetical protein F8M41_008049 [Gigaspora margarita]